MKKETGAGKWEKRLAAYKKKGPVDRAKEVFVRDSADDVKEHSQKQKEPADAQLTQQSKDP